MSTTTPTPTTTEAALAALAAVQERQRRERAEALAPIAQALHQRSLERAPRSPEPPKAPDPADEVVARTERAIAACTSICDNGKRDVARIASAFLGREVRPAPPPMPAPAAVPFQTGFFVVPTNNPNCHNYPLGAASMVLGPTSGGCSTARRPDGSTGNHLESPHNRAFEWRPATQDEIAATITGWSDEQIRQALELP